MPLRAPMATLQLGAGKQQKIRPGDILGALTGEGGLDGSRIGKIKVLARSTYVAVERELAEPALAQLNGGRLKGRTFRARRISG